VVDTVPPPRQRQRHSHRRSYDPSNLQCREPGDTISISPGTESTFASMDPIALKVLNWYPLPQPPAVDQALCVRQPRRLRNAAGWGCPVDALLSEKQNFYAIDRRPQDRRALIRICARQKGALFTEATAPRREAWLRPPATTGVEPTLISSILAGWNTLWRCFQREQQNLTP